jgi:hypothetical protein
LAAAGATVTFDGMPSLFIRFAARCRTPFAASGGAVRAPAPCTSPRPPLLVLRGVSQRGTVRAQAAKVIAVTALHFCTRQQQQR